MTKQYKLLLLCLCTSTVVFSQQIKPFVLNTAGASLTGSTGQITGNLGEIAISKISGNTNQVTQGFLQPKSSLLSVKNESFNTAIQIYPNPTSNEIYFNLKVNEGPYEIKVVDGFGRVLENSILVNNKYALDKYGNGLYQIIVLDAQKKIITQKNISKIN